MWFSCCQTCPGHRQRAAQDSFDAEVDTHASVLDVVESLVHAVVMSQSKPSPANVTRTTTTTQCKLSLDSRTDQEESGKLPTAKGGCSEPKPGMENSLDISQAPEHGRDRPPERTSVSVLVQTDWSLVEVDGPQDLVPKKDVMDQGVQWQTPPPSQEHAATLLSPPQPQRPVPALASPSSQQHTVTSTPSSSRRPVPASTKLSSNSTPQHQHYCPQTTCSNVVSIAVTPKHIAITKPSSSQRPFSTSTSPPREQHLASPTPSLSNYLFQY